MNPSLASTPRSIAALCLLLVCILMPARAAQALDFECVESSKYRNLMRVFGEDPEALLNYFRLPRTLRPPPDACRALIVTGTLAERDGKKLLAEIIKNRGWLAALYLAHSGLNRDEEVKVAIIIRAFWLKTLHFGRGPQWYEPDFIVRAAAPTSSSTTAWPPVPSNKQPLQAGREDYLRTIERKFPETIGKTACTESCVSFFLAGLDRHANAPAAASSKALVQSPGDTLSRTRAALQLWLEDAKFDRNATPLPTPSTIATARRLPSAAAQILRGECSLEIDANVGAQGQVESAIDQLAKTSFNQFARVDALLPRFDAVHTTITRLQTCLAGTYDRRRLAVLKQQCGAKCDLDTIDAGFSQRASDQIKSWGPDVSGSTQDNLKLQPELPAKPAVERVPASSRSSPEADAAPR